MVAYRHKDANGRYRWRVRVQNRYDRPEGTFAACVEFLYGRPMGVRSFTAVSDPYQDKNAGNLWFVDVVRVP